MKLTYTYTPLGETDAINQVIAPGDLTNESPLVWQPSCEGIVQTAAFPDAQEIEVFARGNAVAQFPFIIWRTFTTRANALKFSIEQQQLPGTTGVLKMQNEGLSGGLWTAAVGCQRFQVQQDAGVSILVHYLFVGSRAIGGQQQ